MPVAVMAAASAARPILCFNDFTIFSSHFSFRNIGAG
jgi:hypothetical protein